MPKCSLPSCNEEGNNLLSGNPVCDKHFGLTSNSEPAPFKPGEVRRPDDKRLKANKGKKEETGKVRFTDTQDDNTKFLVFNDVRIPYQKGVTNVYEACETMMRLGAVHLEITIMRK